MRQRQYEQDQYLAHSPSTYINEKPKLADASAFSSRNNSDNPLKSGSVAAEKKRKDIEYKQKVLNVKQGKAFNEKMLNNMANK